MISAASVLPVPDGPENRATCPRDGDGGEPPLVVHLVGEAVAGDELAEELEPLGRQDDVVPPPGRPDAPGETIDVPAGESAHGGVEVAVARRVGAFDEPELRRCESMGARCVAEGGGPFRVGRFVRRGVTVDPGPVGHLLERELDPRAQRPGQVAGPFDPAPAVGRQLVVELDDDPGAHDRRLAYEGGPLGVVGRPAGHDETVAGGAVRRLLQPADAVVAGHRDERMAPRGVLVAEHQRRSQRKLGIA